MTRVFALNCHRRAEVPFASDDKQFQQLTTAFYRKKDEPDPDSPRDPWLIKSLTSYKFGIV